MNKQADGMGRTGLLRGALFVLASLMAGSSEASLFCVMDFAGKRCQFSDLDTCRRAAGKQGGCVLNETEIARPFGDAPFCLVESWRTECVFIDMASCEKRSSTRSVCIANPNGSGMGNSPFGGQMPQGMPAMPGSRPPGFPSAQMPQAGIPGGAPSGFPGNQPTLPSSGGVGSTYLPNAGYWPGL
ncbi:MAG: hypothetical protein HQL64_05520 [Magnetococcales bacterium]|nr:hypothetical protein [Magnetococcales bacterium]